MLSIKIRYLQLARCNENTSRLISGHTNNNDLLLASETHPLMQNVHWSKPLANVVINLVLPRCQGQQFISTLARTL